MGKARVSVMDWVFDFDISCFILKLCPHVSCFTFYFLPLSIFPLVLCSPASCLLISPCVFMSLSSPLSLSGRLFCFFVSVSSCSTLLSCVSGFGSWFLALFLVHNLLSFCLWSLLVFDLLFFFLDLKLTICAAISLPVCLAFGYPLCKPDIVKQAM